MTPNTAQTIILGYFGDGPSDRRYKAPHAYQPTPPRLRKGKLKRTVFSKAHDAMIPARRPFKGHRP